MHARMQVWPIGSKPGGIGDEHLYGPHLMKTIRQAFKNVSEGPQTGARLIGEAPKCELLDADMHACVEGNGTWPVRVATVSEGGHGPSTSYEASSKRKAEATEPARSEEVRAEGSKRPRHTSDVGAVVFNIKDDSGCDCNFRNVRSLADLISKIQSTSGFDRLESPRLEYIQDSKCVYKHLHMRACTFAFRLCVIGGLLAPSKTV